MGAGGIINQRAAVLVTAVMDTSFYGNLSTEDQDCVECIANKAPDQRTKADLIYLADLIKRTCRH